MRYLQDPAGRVYREIDAPAANKLEVVAVISPEDREQVKRLAKSMHESDHIAPWHDLHNETRAQMEDAMQAALREFANPTPPKPDEPQGLGAVVEDAHGRTWVRVAGDDDPGDPKLRATLSPPWRCRGKSAKWWPHLDAVRVLSEGVQP